MPQVQAGCSSELAEQHLAGLAQPVLLELTGLLARAVGVRVEVIIVLIVALPEGRVVLGQHLGLILLPLEELVAVELVELVLGGPEEIYFRVGVVVVVALIARGMPVPEVRALGAQAVVAVVAQEIV